MQRLTLFKILMLFLCVFPCACKFSFLCCSVNSWLDASGGITIATGSFPTFATGRCVREVGDFVLARGIWESFFQTNNAEEAIINLWMWSELNIFRESNQNSLLDNEGIGLRWDALPWRRRPMNLETEIKYIYKDFILSRFIPQNYVQHPPLKILKSYLNQRM